jgi:hypothetical protein
MAELPINMGPSGPIPTPPATLRQQLVTQVAATNPDYTANLPGSLIEDIVSTDVGAIVIANQFFIDLVNSVSPYYANPFILNQLGVDVYGIQPASETNTSVDVIFIGTPGFIIIPGFTVADDNHQYICIDGGVVGLGRESLPIHAIATMAGTWPVPAGSVDQLVTGIPLEIKLACINPSDGIPSIGTENETSFRTRTLVAGLAASTGMDRYLKTLLWNIPGVVQRLVSVRQNLENGKFAILVGGGDPYQVAWAIYYATFATGAMLDSPTIDIIAISRGIPLLVTTLTNHNLVDGMYETITGVVGMEALNGNSYYIKYAGPKTFTLWNSYDSTTIPPTFSDPTDGTYMPYYISGGHVSPNPILQKISLNSYPDTYVIPFILPPQQYVTMTVIWNTNSPNYVSVQAVDQTAAPALANYINSLYVGVSPINVYDMTRIFIDAVDSIVSGEYISVLKFIVYFDGAGQLPDPNTGVIFGDVNSYFATTDNDINVVQG